MEDGVRKKVIFPLLFMGMILFLASCHVRRPYDIRPGMIKEDVIRAWGGAYLPTQQIREGKQVEGWEYRFVNTGAVWRIVFYQDRVSTGYTDEFGQPI
jgi:hypothetical protein